MTKAEFDSIVDKILDMGVEISLTRDEDGITRYNLNTGMKSGLSIYHRNENAHFEGRYDVHGVFHTLDALLIEVRGCRYGRAFASQQWIEAFSAMGWPLFTTTLTNEVVCA